MANDKDKIPFGGRDWNGDGKYDMFDQVTDYYVYKKVTEDWEKNGAWEKKPKKQKPITKPVKQSKKEKLETDIFVAIIFCIMILGLMIFYFSAGRVWIELFLVCIFIYAFFNLLKSWVELIYEKARERDGAAQSRPASCPYCESDDIQSLPFRFRFSAVFFGDDLSKWRCKKCGKKF